MWFRLTSWILCRSFFVDLHEDSSHLQLRQVLGALLFDLFNARVHVEHPKKGGLKKQVGKNRKKSRTKYGEKNKHIKTSRNVLRLYRWWLIYPFRNCCLSPLWFVGQNPPPSYLCPSPFLVGKIPIWNKRAPRYTYFLVNDSRVFVTSTILLAWLWNPNFRLETRIVDESLHFCSWKYAV